MTIAALGGAPVDSYGVGANVVTGMGAPTAGFVYKLVAIGDPGDAPGTPQRPVAKRSAGKASFGGRKWAWRALLDECPRRLGPGAPSADGPVWADIVTTSPQSPEAGARPLEVRAIDAGEVVHRPALAEVRTFHAEVRDAIGPNGPLVLDRR